MLGMVERNGNIKAVPVDNVQKKTLMPHITATVEKGSRISTDELRSYNALKDEGYQHDCVTHAAMQFVKGDTHVQSVEGFWSRLKLSVKGTHVHVSRQHLGKYVDEFAFRYNNRTTPASMFDVVLSGVQQA